MARAEVVLPNGTKISIEGTEEEVRFLLETYESRATGRVASPSSSGKKQNTLRRPIRGPKTYVRELREEGFFSSKQTLKSVQEKLEQKGHIYPQNSLSAALIRLTKDGMLGRMREDGVWVYVNRE